MPASVENLVSLFDLETLEVDLFRGDVADTDRQRVYGGQVAAQALVAVARTTDPAYVLHSLHSYFLHPGDNKAPIVYDVERIRDGRSFATRRVAARQHGRPIFYLTADLQKHEDGLEHQDAMPDVPGPDQSMPMVDLVRMRGERAGEAWQREWAALDLRYAGVTGQGIESDPAHPAQARVWVRVDGRLDDDPLTHLAAFTYASDLTLLGASLVPHGVLPGQPGLQMASLDHTVWFHRPFRADEWWLYDQVSPAAVGGRGLSLGRVFTPDGVLVATVAQEGLIRMREKEYRQD